jgi:hypothetical protein
MRVSVHPAARDRIQCLAQDDPPGTAGGGPSPGRLAPTVRGGPFAPARSRAFLKRRLAALKFVSRAVDFQLPASTRERGAAMEIVTFSLDLSRSLQKHLPEKAEHGI